MTGMEPVTPVCALAGNGTRSLLVYRMMLQPTGPAGQGAMGFYVI